MIWKTNTVYIDRETGEVLTEKQAKEAYVITKKIKKTTVNKTTHHGTVEITAECWRSKQGNLFS